MVAGDNTIKAKKKIFEIQKKIIYPTELKKGISNNSIAPIITLNGIPSILARSNDDIHSLSARAGISEKKFRKYNEIGSADDVVPNKFYYIKKKKGKSTIGFHVVRRGESLWHIAQFYGIQKGKLAKMNRMSIMDELETGRVLWMKKVRPANVAIAYHQPEASVAIDESHKDEDSPVSPILVPVVNSSKELKKVKIHTVAQGESLWGIAKKYGVMVEDLLRWNELGNPGALQIGQNMQVKAPFDELAVSKEIATHKVMSGETLYAISRKYQMTVDELMELNGKKNANLDVGEKLKVYAN